MKKHTYKDAGVDVDYADSLVSKYRALAATTSRGVISDIGGFGAMFKVPSGYLQPVLVSSTDGVGTKLKLAFETKKHDTIGIDLVAMSVNDVIVQGAQPLFFLDYFATGRLEASVAVDVVKGIVEGCRLADCPLIGGETAEMPGMYENGEYDLAGFCVGIVEKSRIISGAKILPGDAILGIASSGVHSNGYSLVRKIISTNHFYLDDMFDDDRTIGEIMMTPTLIYTKSILSLVDNFPVGGIAHITGGGIVGNLPRILPTPVRAIIERSAWPVMPVFDWIQREGDVADEEMLKVFNCGIGMIVVVPETVVGKVVRHLEGFGETVYHIGTIEMREETQDQIEVIL